MGLEFIARDAHLQRASLLAQRGLLPDARLELETCRPAAGNRLARGEPAEGRGLGRVRPRRPQGGRGGRGAQALDRVRPGLSCVSGLGRARHGDRPGRERVGGQGHECRDGGARGSGRPLPGRARLLPPGSPAGSARMARVRRRSAGGRLREPAAVPARGGRSDAARRACSVDAAEACRFHRLSRKERSPPIRSCPHWSPPFRRTRG